MEENKNALDEVNKGCTMGVEAINNLIDKITNSKFKEVLEKEVNSYHETEKKVHDLYSKYGDDKPHEIGPVTKVMTDYMLQTKTMMDHSDSKIAEILLQGTNMGIIEGRKIINNKNLNSEVKDLIEQFVEEQEKSVENLKKYL